MISRKEIIIPSPRARRNTSNGNAVRIDRREKEGRERSLEKLRQGKERPPPPPTIVPVLREVTRSDR